jgi:hypothetical protein
MNEWNNKIHKKTKQIYVRKEVWLTRAISSQYWQLEDNEAIPLKFWEHVISNQDILSRQIINQMCGWNGDILRYEKFQLFYFPCSLFVETTTYLLLQN